MACRCLLIELHAGGARARELFVISSGPAPLSRTQSHFVLPSLLLLLPLLLFVAYFAAASPVCGQHEITNAADAADAAAAAADDV